MQNHVLDYLDETVKRVPDKVAFANESDAYTFREVYETTHSVGTYLHQEGCYREAVVVFMEKHPKTIMAFYGVIASGCYYVPIDEEMPQNRIDLILENCKPKIIICDDTTIEKAKCFQYQTKLVLFDDIRTTPSDELAIQRD